MKITPEKYNKLSDKDKEWYLPGYSKFKKVRESNHCEECGHFTGYSWHEKSVGKITHYNKMNNIEMMAHISMIGLRESMEKSFYEESIFTKIMKKEK